MDGSAPTTKKTINFKLQITFKKVGLLVFTISRHTTHAYTHTNDFKISHKLKNRKLFLFKKIYIQKNNFRNQKIGKHRHEMHIGTCIR